MWNDNVYNSIVMKEWICDKINEIYICTVFLCTEICYISFSYKVIKLQKNYFNDHRPYEEQDQYLTVASLHIFLSTHVFGIF